MPKARESRPELGSLELGISKPSFLASFSLNGSNIYFIVVLLLRRRVTTETVIADVLEPFRTVRIIFTCDP